MIYVGMDVHVRNSYFHVSDASGQRLKRGRCGNTLVELGEFLGPFEGDPMRVSLESTTNSRAIHRLLTAYGREAGIDLTAEVLDARRLRIIAESVTKCDRIDAQVLSELSRSNLKLPVCYLPDDEEFALREHLRARSDLVRIRTMLKNRVHAVLHRRGILAPRAGLFTKAGRMFLEQVEMDEAGRTVLERYLSTMDHLDATIKASNESLRELTRRPRWAKPAALLGTMPGIGLVTSLTILAELGDLTRFRSRAAVANYAGLVPMIRDSNEKRFRGGISRRGSNHLRAVMVEAAWVAVNRVPVYRHLFDRITHKRGKPTAIVAVARRMLEDGFVMLRKDQAFRYVAPPTAKPPTSESRVRRPADSSVAG